MPTGSSAIGSLHSASRPEHIVSKTTHPLTCPPTHPPAGRVRVQLTVLKKYTYGKHIVARVEKLLCAGTKIQTHLRARPLPDDTAPL